MSNTLGENRLYCCQGSKNWWHWDMISIIIHWWSSLKKMLFCAFCVLKQQLKALLLSFDFFSNNTIEKFCCGVTALTKRRIENCPISDLVNKTNPSTYLTYLRAKKLCRFIYHSSFNDCNFAAARFLNLQQLQLCLKGSTFQQKIYTFILNT